MKILIVDDHAIVRRGLIHVLGAELTNAEFGEASDGAEALGMVRKKKWNAVILDLNMPGAGGLDVVKDLRELAPDIRILIVSVQPESQIGLRALKAGASGYVPKDKAPEEIVKAVRCVLAGGRYISPELADSLATRISSNEPPVSSDILSDREFAVLKYIYEGRSLKEIALRLDVTAKTVSTYRQRILDKLGLDSNSAIVQFVVKNRLFE